MEEFRWGILGPGSIAHEFADALPFAPGAVLHAVGSRDPGRAQAFAAKHGARRAYGSYEELVRDKDLDAVYIATPHPMHCENALACLERGIPVLVEKPMSINARSERRMVEAARRNRTFLMEAMWTRFLPASRAVSDIVASGRIGEPRVLTLDFSYSGEPDIRHRNFDPYLAGGGILDVGIYTMAFASMVFGSRPSETASFGRIGATGVDENAAMVLRYPGGGLATMTCGVRARGPQDARLMGTGGRIELSPFWASRSLRIVDDAGEEVLPFPFDGNGYEYEIREVMDCVRQGLLESPLMTLDESVDIMETMDGMRRSWGLVFPPETEGSPV